MECSAEERVPLPAYRQFGYRVVACCDIREEAAREAQWEFAIPFATTRLEELLARPGAVLPLHAGLRGGLATDLAQNRGDFLVRIQVAGKHLGRGF
jgi:predicted dehydrogenase